MLATSVARADEQVDPNAPGVARISIVQGSVAVQRGDSAQPVEAAVNAPVLGADYITTGDNARAEVQFDAVSSVRLGDNVQMRFTRIDPNDRELQLAEGTVEVRLLRGDDGSATVDTPSISVRAQDGGSYRVSVDADGRTSVTVREGAAQIITPQGQQDLQPGTTLVASGTASDPQIDTTQAIAMDGFDAFNQDCDTHEQVALEDDHVVPQMQGVADLDNDGRWVDDSQSGYGEAWIPNDVPADWAPYRDGRWAWEDAYGWTWVGAEPWGWAPYHYGRWYHSPLFGWAWYPGPRVYTAWAPAYVAFFGFNLGGVSIDLGFGNVGWLPIGPREVFHPWWGGGYAYRDVAVLDFNGIARYRNYRWGVTSVTRENFLAGRFAAHVAVSPERLRDARFAGGRLGLVPTTANLRYSDRNVSVRVAARTVFAERSFAGHAQAVNRVPFAEARTAVAAGRPVERPAATRFNGESAAYGRAVTRSEGYATRGTTPAYGTRGTTSAYGTRGTTSAEGTQPRGEAYGSQRSYAAPNGARTDVTPRANDPWSRFSASRGEAAGANRVQTYDGSRSTNGYPSRVQTYDGARSAQTQQRSWTSSPSYGQRSSVTPSYGTSATRRSSDGAPSYGSQRSTYGTPSYGVHGTSGSPSYASPSYNTQRSYNGTPSYGTQRSYNGIPSYQTQRSYNGTPSYGAQQRSYGAPSYGTQQRS